MSNEDICPWTCKHNWSMLSHSSGSGTGLYYQHTERVCLRCGMIGSSGFELMKDGKIHRYNREFTIDLPEAVEAIINNCNRMNREIEGYKPFIQEP